MVLDHELKREYQEWLQEPNRGWPTVTDGPIGTRPRSKRGHELALHTTIQRIDGQRENGEAARWEQDLAELRKEFATGATKRTTS